MSPQSRVYSSDEQWRVVLSTWRSSFLIYNEIGANVKVQHWEEVSSWLFWKKWDWVDRPAEAVSVHARFEGLLPSTVPGAADLVDRRSNSSEAKAVIWSFGINIKLDGAGSSPPIGAGAPNLDVRSVTGTGGATVNGESLRPPEVATR